MTGVTHPGLQPVTVEPKLIPFFLHLLKLAAQLLDLLLWEARKQSEAEVLRGVRTPHQDS